MGINALYSNTTKSNLVAIGDSALFNNGIGLAQPINSLYNVAVGSKALFANTLGSHNTATGYWALRANTFGWANTAMGSYTLYSNTDGDWNTAVGGSSMEQNTSGSFNTAIGQGALHTNTTGEYNTAIGYGAILNSGGINNSAAIGAQTRVDCSNCMVLGSVNGINNATSNVRVGIGTTNPTSALHVRQGSAGGSAPYGPLSVETNSAAYFGLLTPDNFESGIIFGKNSNNVSGGIVYNNGANPDGMQFRVSGNNTRMVINSLGQVGIGTTLPTQALHVVGNVCASGVFLACSDVRYKRDLVHIHNPLQSVLSMNGVYYLWKTDEFPNLNFPTARQLGFSAQEVELFFPEIVMTDANGYKSVDYGRLTPVLVEAIKEQQQQINNLEKQLNEVKALLNKLVKQ